MEYVELTAGAHDRRFLRETVSEPAQNRLGFRAGSSLFVTSIFDTAFRLDRVLARIPREARALRWNRVLVVGPGLNIVDQFLGTQVPVSSPQPVCLLKSLFAHELVDGRVRVDLADLNPEVITHWREAVHDATDYRLLGYLLSGETHGDLGRLTRAYLDGFGARILSSGKGLFRASRPSQGILWTTPAGELRFLRDAGEGVYLREVFARPGAIKRFSPQLSDIVTDRISSPGAYDLVVATNLLLYFDSVEAALAVFNMSRLLKAGGYLVVTEDIDALLPNGHPLRRSRVDSLAGLTPSDVNLPTFFVYRKQGAPQARDPEKSAKSKQGSAKTTRQDVASDLIPPMGASTLAGDPSPGLRDRVKSSQDFTFGHPLPTNGRGSRSNLTEV